MTERTELPRVCYTTGLEGTPEANQLRVIKRGEEGYYVMAGYETPGMARRIADERNAVMGVSKLVEEAMVNGSMFGWNTPGADPDYLAAMDQRKELEAKYGARPFRRVFDPDRASAAEDYGDPDDVERQF